MDSHTRPATLRTIAGLPDRPPSLADAILVVIDAQQAYARSGVLRLAGVESATERIVRLLDRARSEETSIIHVAHTGGPGSPFDPLDGGRFLCGVEPRHDEIIVSKTLPNAFAGTDLLKLVSRDEPNPLVIVGFMTHMCVSSTARAALDLGFETTVVSDATATRSLPGASDGAVVPAATIHAAALAALADRFSVVTTTDHLVEG